MDGFKRGKGRLKKYWTKVIRRDMAQLQFTKGMALDKKVWRTRVVRKNVSKLVGRSV